MKKFLHYIWELAKIVIVTLVIVVPIRYFLFQPFIVRGQSMEPNFHNGDYLIIDEISYRFREPKRGEVVVFKSPNTSSYLIKRVVGLPGETVEIRDGQVIIYQPNSPEPISLNETDYLSGEIYQIPGSIRIALAEDEYFVLGDNRQASFDSRRWGALSEDEIIGRVFLRAWPLTVLAKFELPTY